MSATSDHVRELLADGSLVLDLPASGNTAERLHWLCGLARSAPIGVARLVEAHTDAIAILAEAGHAPFPGSLYGVWASQQPQQGVSYDRESKTIDGTMGFASGLGIVDRALITATTDAGTVLIDTDVAASRHESIQFDTESWSTPALADTATGPVTFTGHHVDPTGFVGAPSWYLKRVGFWQGACAPAACWAGGAIGLVDTAGRLADDDPHRRAHYGALLAHQWALEALIGAAGDEIDASPSDALVAERVARSLRFTVVNTCRDVLDRFGRAFGPRPYVQGGDVAQRAADLDLYIKQHHAERELPAISHLWRSS